MKDTETAAGAHERSDALPSNWGRWGEDDELGTLRYITPAVRARAVSLATDGICLSLAEPIDPVTLAGGGPTARAPVAMPAPVQQVVQVHPVAQTDVLIFNTHHVDLTHMDAPIHIPVDGRVYPGIPAHEALQDGVIMRSSSTRYADGIVTRGVLLDLRPGGKLREGHDVGAADLEEAVGRAGVTVESGDAIVARSGWKTSESADRNVPAMTVDAVRWLHEQEASLFVGDINDRPTNRPTVDPLAIHQVALARLGMPDVSGANVDPLADVCAELNRYAFLLVVAPPSIRGATGLPVNPIAIF